MRPSEVEFNRGKRWLVQGASVQTFRGWLKRLELISFDDIRLLMDFYRVGIEEIGTMEFFLKYVKNETKK